MVSCSNRMQNYARESYQVQTDQISEPVLKCSTRGFRVAVWQAGRSLGCKLSFYPSQFCLSSPSLLFAVYRLSVQVEHLPDFTLLYSFLLTSRPCSTCVHVFQNSVVSCKMWSIVKNLKQKPQKSKVVQVKQDYDKDYVNKYFLLHEILLFPLKGISVSLLFQCFSAD